MKREETIKKLKEICGDYADILGLVILFGSYSRDEANEKSDFDLIAYGGKRDIANMRKTPLWTQIQKDGVRIYDERTETFEGQYKKGA